VVNHYQLLVEVSSISPILIGPVSLLHRFIIVSFLFFAWSCRPVASAEVNCSIAASALKKASKIRGLSPIEEVPCKLQNRKEVAAFVSKTIKEKIPQEKLLGEEIVYKMLGLIPYDYDYRKGIVELYTGNLGGYYDPDNDFYAMASWMPEKLQPAIAVHELVHALQDQHFVIDKLLDPKQYSSDQLNARSALAEGDATAVTLDWVASLQNQPALAEREDLSQEFVSGLVGADRGLGDGRTPDTLKKILVFPYIHGLKFVHAILRREGYQGVNKAFKRLPESSEQILHPEIYLSGKRGSRDINFQIPEEFKSRFSDEPYFVDRLGEFFISVLLSEMISADKAVLAAKGWGGDKVAYYQSLKSERKKSPGFNNSGLLIWESSWDTEADSNEFFHALGQGYSKRFNVPFNRRPGKYNFTDKKIGRTILTRRGSRVQLLMESLWPGSTVAPL